MLGILPHLCIKDISRAGTKVSHTRASKRLDPTHRTRWRDPLLGAFEFIKNPTCHSMRIMNSPVRTDMSFHGSGIPKLLGWEFLVIGQDSPDVKDKLLAWQVSYLTHAQEICPVMLLTSLETEAVTWDDESALFGRDPSDS